MSPRPNIEVDAFMFKIGGIISLAGMSYEVATATITDFAPGNTYGLRKTQKIS